MFYRFRKSLSSDGRAWTWNPERAIGPRAWQVHVRTYVNASDGEEKYYAKLVRRCRRYKTVCNSRVVLLINKLMREKRHWENQVISLGGANYRKKCRHVRL